MRAAGAFAPEEIGAFFLQAFDSVDNVAVAVQAVLMYRAEPELFDSLLEGMEQAGLPMLALQADADRLLAELRACLRPEDESGEP